METIGSFEAKTKWSALLDKVADGKEIVITKRGKPVARLIPESNALQQEMDNVIHQLKALRKGATLGKLNWKDLRDEGMK